ncbi:MAG: CvpA family protein, partial [Holosporales bacterium]|nr:CvpA family protein [Holosporales bacterium]
MIPPVPDTFSMVDYVVISALAFSSIIGFLRGLTREALGLLSWIGAIWGTSWLEPFVRPFLTDYIHHPTALSVCSIGGSFLVLLIVGTFISHGIAGVIQKSGLSSIDRTLGIPFGFVRGYLIISGALLIYATFSKETLPYAIENAKFFPIVRYGALWVHSLMDSLPDALQALPAEQGGDF